MNNVITAFSILVFILFLYTIYYSIGLPRAMPFLTWVSCSNGSKNGGRKWENRERIEKNYSEIMASLISVDGWFFPTDWLLFSSECLTTRRVTLNGTSHVSYLTPSDNHIRVIRSTNIGNDTAHDYSCPVVFPSFKSHARFIFLPLLDEVKVHGVEFQKVPAFVCRNCLKTCLV